MKRCALILAGGAGTRLRPLSTDENPKQFLRLFGGRSLLELTFARAARLVGAASVFVSTNDVYAEKTRQFLPEMPPENVLPEPARRNTAPAVALSCFTIEARNGPCAIAELHSDHFIADEDEFVRVLGRAYRHAEESEDLVTIAIEPTFANTEYGYLELGEEVAPEVLRVRRFVEKPSPERAEEFLRAGNYAWNAGMFVWRSDVFRAALESVAPDVARVTRETYAEAPSISIDYALMEKAPRVAAVRGNFGWSDVGSLEALARVGVDVSAYIRR